MRCAKNLLLCSALTFQAIGFAGTDSIILKSSSGEEFLLSVAPDARFSDVMVKISDSLDAIDCEQGDTEQLASKKFKIQVTEKSVSASKICKKLAGDQSRIYALLPTPAEVADITYLLRTLANESLVKLKGKESTLKKVGDRVDHVHPFNFLYCVFSNEELKVCIRNIQGRSWVGKSFIDGLTSSLAKENSTGNLLPFAQDFANRLNIDVNIILPTLQAGQWDKFVDVLIKTIPRSGNTSRYDL